MALCPCGSNTDYSSCCEPYIEGTAAVPTAEKLMRSRYTAFTLSKVKYIVDSCHPSTRDSIDQSNIREWASKSEWHGFDIIRIEEGGESDEKGIVEFIAKYDNSGEHHLHHEISDFRKEDGIWYFYDGELVADVQPIVNQEPKQGRNDPCSCGSGKKYKKCCGK